MQNLKLLFTITLFMVFTRESPAIAQKVWSGAGSTNQFSESSNWQGNQLPTAVDDILIDLAATSVVEQDVNATVNSVRIENGEVTWTGPGMLSTTDSQNGLVIDDSGRLTVSGDAEISISGWLKMGDTVGSLDNRLTLSNGGRVTSQQGYVGWSLNSGAQVSITEAEWNVSDQLTVGHDGDGQLSVTNGGEVTVGGTSYIGANASGSGTVLLQSTSPGRKAKLTMNEAIIGYNSTADVQVRMDSILTTNTNSYVAYQGDATSRVRVSGARAVWNNNADLDVGVNGTAVGLIDVFAGGVANFNRSHKKG